MITNSIKRTNKRSGFIAMTTSLVVAIFLFLISAAVMNYANQSLRTEAWMADRAQRSLYPIAWSTANFVLRTISGDLGANGRIINLNRRTIFVSGDLITQRVVSFDLHEISASIDIRAPLSITQTSATDPVL